MAKFGRACFEQMNDIGVNLLQSNERKVARAEDRLEAAAVFDDVFASVPVRETKIQNPFA